MYDFICFLPFAAAVYRVITTTVLPQQEQGGETDDACFFFFKFTYIYMWALRKVNIYHIISYHMYTTVEVVGVSGEERGFVW